jgi:hypothetical protein
MRKKDITAERWNAYLNRLTILQIEREKKTEQKSRVYHHALFFFRESHFQCCV